MQTKLIIAGITGRMGSSIARLAQENGFILAGAVDRAEMLEKAAVWGIPCAASAKEIFAQIGPATIIDFTAPAATMDHLLDAVEYGGSMVIGTTGCTDEQKAVIAESAKKIPVFMSPNMGIGINALTAVLPKLARILGDTYDAEIMEIHHKHKKDAPSGTALRLGECLAESRGQTLNDIARCSREGIVGERTPGEIGIQTLRGGDVAGVHTVYFLGEGERIEITHHAHSRDVFAHGALRAASWLSDKPAGRIYTMKDLME